MLGCCGTRGCRFPTAPTSRVLQDSVTKWIEMDVYVKDCKGLVVGFGSTLTINSCQLVLFALTGQQNGRKEGQFAKGEVA